MDKSATLNLRVNPTVKEQAENVLRQLGIPMSTAIDMFLNQVTLVKGNSFPCHAAPGSRDNQCRPDGRTRDPRKTQKGLEDAEQGRSKGRQPCLRGVPK